MSSVYATYSITDLLATRKVLLGSITRARTAQARRVKTNHSVSSLTKSYDVVVAELNSRGVY